MEQRELNKEQIIEETMKIIGSIEIPVALNKIGIMLNGCLNNLKIVLQMMEAEKQAQEEQKDEADIE